ncbi:Adenylate cyclase type 9 [Labeo rohita]|uniref:adenylate cyclase n=1 Tax=Labeo rohita TaxID=84645 RepID=A0ABQ8LIR4_LABRO|nr:Adenylate cyclase type 9 [Labeo rohita]
MGSQCGCSQLSLGRDVGEMLSPSSNTHTPDLTHFAVDEPLSHGKPVCTSCSISVDVVDSPIADEATRNGCQDEHRANSSKRVRVSQSSLCDKLQEKDRSWVGSLAAEGGSASGMDHSAILPLRSKNFREKSDVHFVEVVNQVPMQTFASPVFSSLLDVCLSCVVFIALTIACFLYPPVTMGTALATTLGLAITAALLELVSLVLSIRMVFCLDNVQNCTRSLLKLVSGWLPRHVIGAVLVSLPAVSVFSHLAYSLQLPIQVTMFLCCALIIAIIQYCNFCQLSFWMRSALATVAGLNMSNQSAPVDQSGELDSAPTALDLLVLETVLSFFLLLLLVWFLNREFEVSYRLHYHGNVEADKHRIKIQTMRDQADWLLRNIIPIHVAEQLKVNQSYSKNHDNVGVIFASIVNFSEFYEESYEGGKECYRVLNELIGDFDELLRKPAFSNVEKIKTIGATYMAASGLNGQQCQEQPHPHAHLRALFDFALEMMRVVDDFNKNMLGFKFKLRIGFNHGPLTAGVIGTTKLLYDIWGDTVNIASRMDSTGVECRIQVSEESHCVLSRMNYAFDYRGTVNVKGKGQMRTYLYPQMNEGRTGSTQSLEQGQVDGAVGHLDPTPNALANATTTTTAAPLNPSTSISGHGVPQGFVLGPSQITKELHQDTKDNSPVPELKEKDYESPYQAPSLSGTQPPSIAQLYAPLARPETPLQAEEDEDADERTKLRAVE